jgi:hypothetical protein
MTAQGGYEWLYKPIEQKATNRVTAALQNITTVQNIAPIKTYSEPIAEKPVINDTTAPAGANTSAQDVNCQTQNITQ